MIVYKAKKSMFVDDVRSNQVVEKILSGFDINLKYRTSGSETSSWRNSLNFMKNILETPEIPDNATVALEYRIPRTGKRIDCIIAGKSPAKTNEMVIVELKQWTNADLTTKDGIVQTYVGGGIREVGHPSYQAWTYAELIRHYNMAIDELKIGLHPCAYLHNCSESIQLKNEFYQQYLDKAPLFDARDFDTLSQFITNKISFEDDEDIITGLEKGKIKPSVALADALGEMMKGNPAFLMIDDQKVVFETALHLASKSSSEKNVMIVKGGPGSGKSVVAVNLLSRLLKLGQNAQYVSKNAAPRAVFQNQLTGTYRKGQLAGLFGGSGQFVTQAKNAFDTLIVDEAHRLNLKSGLYSNLGENQIKEIISSSKCSVFMLDEDQVVTLKDIGSEEEIVKCAEIFGAKVHFSELRSQFRCNGSDGYLSWLDNTLQIRPTSNELMSEVDYNIEIIESPDELYSKIVRLNRENNKARIVAGYCWPWASKKDSSADDIIIGKTFRKKWNLTEHGSAWIAHKQSVEQVGCIHTCQGLEVDYIGVIIGPDLVIRNDRVITDPSKRAKGDQSLKGRLKLEKEESRLRCDRIIKNTYRTLMTRGSKGCFIYCCDPETQEFFRNAVLR
jgi:DUF2075 family protein